MADPHDKKRYGEVWDPTLIANLKELVYLKELVVFSGGWAWHFMSPLNHVELKHAHDHKDVDIFVLPHNIQYVLTILNSLGFERVSTRFDRLKDNDDFRRYEKPMQTGKKLIIDFFVRKDLQITSIFGWHVVAPEQLLTFYKTIHSSDNCFAVKAAAELLSKGINPIGRNELVTIRND